MEFTYEDMLTVYAIFGLAYVGLVIVIFAELGRRI